MDKTGTYYDTIQVDGCDSVIYKLSFRVLELVKRDTTMRICQGDYVNWKGHRYEGAGNYTIQEYTQTSVISSTLHLIVDTTYFTERRIALCNNSSYLYKNSSNQKQGFYITKDTIINDTIATVHGCDSVNRLVFIFRPTYEQWDTVKIVQGTSYRFDERDLRATGDYKAVHQSIYGCDSINYLHLEVVPSYHFNDSITLCRHELPYTHQWDTTYFPKHTTFIAQNNIKECYIDSFATREGFDSIFTLKVKIFNDTIEKHKFTLKDGFKITIFTGRVIEEAGQYIDTLYTEQGCYRIIHSIVNGASTVKYDEAPVYICPGDTYQWKTAHGIQEITKQGDYYDSVMSPAGDTIWHLQLTVWPKIPITKQLIVKCLDDMPYVHYNKLFYHDTVFTDTLIGSHSCDSVIQYELRTDNVKCSQWSQIPLCEGDTIFMYGDTITKTGQYQFVMRSAGSSTLDSIHRIEVYKAPSFESKLTKVTICQGDTFWVEDHPITRTGLHDIILKTKQFNEGCDSIIHIDMTVNPKYHFVDTIVTVPDYRPYLWRGITYQQSGTYDVVFPTIKGCDSIHTLILTVVETEYRNDTVYLCQGETYKWHGKVLSESGIYCDTTFNASSQISRISTLLLEVSLPTELRAAYVSDTCADAEQFQIYFTYGGNRPDAYSITFDEQAHEQNFKDIYNAQLPSDNVISIPIPQGALTIYKGHTNYVRPAYYKLRLILMNNYCGDVRSNELTVLIHYPSWIIEQIGTNIVSPLAAMYNGGHSFGSYEWYVNGFVAPTTGQGYLYNTSLKKGDEVVMKATRIGESYSIPTCPMIITDPQAIENTVPILVTPTSTPKQHAAVTLQATEQGDYVVYGTTGQIITRGVFVEGEQTILLPSVAGCYVIYATTTDGFVINQKVLLY